jgi:hypothetical protein
MKTDDLINALAADGGPSASLRRLALWPSVLGIAGAIALFALFIGVRHDLGEAFGTWRFVAKLALVAIVLTLTARAFVTLQRPDGRASAWPFAGAALALGGLVAIELIAVPPAGWSMAAMGKNSIACLSTIPLLASAPLVAALWAMRSAAPASPALAGASAGGLAAAVGALLYATHCTDDSPLFVALWYPLAAAIVIAAGAVAGRQLLRW